MEPTNFITILFTIILLAVFTLLAVFLQRLNKLLYLGSPHSLTPMGAMTGKTSSAVAMMGPFSVFSPSSLAQEPGHSHDICDGWYNEGLQDLTWTKQLGCCLP